MTGHELPAWVTWPNAWRNIPLWAMFDRVKDVGHPDEEMLSVYRQYGVVKKDSRNDNTNQTAENRDIYQLIEDSWLVVNRMKAWQGSVGISPFHGIVSGHYICFRPRHNEDSRFLNWLLRSAVYALEYSRMSRGVRPGQIEIDNDELRGLRIALPPFDEQQQIADFLNHETTGIDNLIAARSQQLTIIEELTLSKVSSIVPSKSEVKFVRLGYLAAVQSGITVDGNRPPGVNEVLHPYLRVANVQSGHLDLGSVAKIIVPGHVAQSSMLRDGDVLMTEGGDLDKLGRGTVWHNEIKSCLHQNHVFAVRPDQRKLDPDYLALITRTAYARSYFESTGSKTTNLASTSSSKIRDFRIPLIDIAEQARIYRETAAWLDNIARIESAIRQQLTLLTERRQALITAAVTGGVRV